MINPFTLIVSEKKKHCFSVITLNEIISKARENDALIIIIKPYESNTNKKLYKENENEKDIKSR